MAAPQIPGPRGHATDEATLGALLSVLPVEASRQTSAVVHPSMVNAQSSGTEDTNSPVATWPCTCGAGVSIESDECPACGTRFLDLLRESTPETPRKGIPGLVARLASQSRGMRFALAGVFAAIVGIVVPVLLAVIG